MKGFIKYAVTFIAGLGAGIPIGCLIRKKVSEVQFVETTEEDQIAAMIANGDDDMIPVDKKDIKRPTDIQKAIDGIFAAKAEIPSDLSETTKQEVENEKNREAGMRQMDTQKVQYFKKWEQDAANPAEKYDTGSNEMAEDNVDLPEETKQFVDDISQDTDGDEHFGDGRPPVEAASKEDWEHWESKDDGAYDCVKIYWFDEDDALTDEDGEEIPNPEKYMGFDVKTQFEENDGGTHGDPDVRYVYVHRKPGPAIFKVIRRHTSFSRKRGMEEFGNDYDGDEDDSDEYLRSRQ